VIINGGGMDDIKAKYFIHNTLFVLRRDFLTIFLPALSPAAGFISA
jgi:hypothetical protein